MILTKKHIGALFDVNGGDGSWYYILVDVKPKELLFLTNNGTWEIEPRCTSDWRLVDEVCHKNIRKDSIKKGWKEGRRQVCLACTREHKHA